MAGLLNPLRTERSWSAEVGIHSTNRRSSRIQSNPLRRKSGGTAAVQRHGNCLVEVLPGDQSSVRRAQLPGFLERFEQFSQREFAGLEYQDRRQGPLEPGAGVSGQQHRLAEPENVAFRQVLLSQ
jgi:hypothetical protein